MMQIDQLQIRIPGLNEATGSEMGKSVAERIADLLPANSVDRYIPELKIQLREPLPAGTSLAADRIAEQVVREIRLLAI